MEKATGSGAESSEKDKQKGFSAMQFTTIKGIVVKGNTPP
jgi:hypothetical protein